MHHHHHPDGSLTRRRLFSTLMPAAIFAERALAQNSSEMAERFRRMSEDAERKGLAEPFKGVTTNAGVEPNLFKIERTGVSTDSLRTAAERFLSSLTDDQRKRT